MTIEVNVTDRPKGRSALWGFKILDKENIVFDDSWVSIKFLNQKSAIWMAEIVEKLYEKGLILPRTAQKNWERDLDYDCILQEGNLFAHAEHMEGPKGKGGIWYCQVHSKDRRYFHTSDHDIQPRSGAAARWLCEIIILAVINRILVGEVYA